MNSEYFAERFNVEEILNVKETEWTAPKWAVKGDIVFFFMQRQHLEITRMLETKLKQEKGNDWEKHSIPFDRQKGARKLYEKCTEKNICNFQDFRLAHLWCSEGDEIFIGQVDFMHPLIGFMCLVHWHSQKAQICIEPQSAITLFVGNDFERLKALIALEKWTLGVLLKESEAIPLPLQKINAENLVEITEHYRRLFQLEIIIPTFYVIVSNVLKEQKKFYGRMSAAKMKTNWICRQCNQTWQKMVFCRS